MNRKKLRDPLVWFGIIFMVGLVLFAIFGPMIPTKPGLNPVFDNVAAPHAPPGTAGALLGTDEIGRSFLQRLAYGARISLLVGITVQLINLTVGVTMGAIGTFAPKWIRVPVLRLTDGMFAFPDILLAILIVGVMDRKQNSFIPVIVALCVTGWPAVARISRNLLVSLKEREFVVAAQASGASTFYLVVRHMLPQMTGILMAVSMVELAGTILAESTLSFLGIGVLPPEPSWGTLINNARLNMNSYPIELIWPCTILSVTVFSLNFIGDGLRAYFDPKSSNR
jgi:ABC-type dipeptide/oligopeptide/nickel transport system permease subunit